MSDRAVLFDLDGTLLDTLVDIADATNAVLAQLGQPTHSLDQYRFFIGDGVSVLFQRALPAEQRVPAMLDQCMAGFEREYGRRWDQSSCPYPGVVEMLAALAKRAVPLAVLSNKPDEFTKKCVTRYFAETPFRAVVGQRPAVPRKPDPAAAHEIARTLGIAEGEFLYVGDTPTDMQTARNAGMFAIGVTWGFRSADELRSAGAAAIMSEPQELLGYFA
jgi:phosphoglycolate phosphatase